MNTQTADNAQFDNELRQTELGTVVAENKWLIIGLVALLFLGAIGFGVYQNSLKATNQEAATQAYLFESANFEKFEKGELDAKKLIENFNSEMSAYKGAAVYTASSIRLFDTLSKKGADALSVIKDLNGSNIYQIYALSTRKAVAFENSGDFAAAIVSLKLLDSPDFKEISGKINLDLGRLYLLSGNKESAKIHLDKVITSNTQKEFKSLAVFYLSKL